MIIATVIYLILAALLGTAWYKIETALFDFESSKVARYAALRDAKNCFITITVIYLVVMLCIYFG